MNKGKELKKEKLKSKYKEERFRILFEYSPIAIWEEDFSALIKTKKYLERQKVEDIKDYLIKHRGLVIKTFRQVRILDVNQAALKLYGAKTKKQLIQNFGKRVNKDVFRVLVDEMTTLVRGEQTYETEFKSRRLDGKTYDVYLKVSVPDVYKDTFKRVIITMQDISLQKKHESYLKRIARTDGLTNLINQQTFKMRLEEEFYRAKRYDLDFACMMIDMDHFKKINDNFGHEEGNKVIKRTAKLIKDNLRDVDIVARYGGDEFCIILPETSVEHAIIAASRLRHVFSTRAKTTTKKRHYTTLSIGVAGVKSKAIKAPQDILDRADDAMYEAKKAGRDYVVAK